MLQMYRVSQTGSIIGDTDGELQSHEHLIRFKVCDQFDYGRKKIGLIARRSREVDSHITNTNFARRSVR